MHQDRILDLNNSYAFELHRYKDFLPLDECYDKIKNQADRIAELEKFSKSTGNLLLVEDKYENINELTPDLVRIFIDKVVVHQAEKTDDKRKQVVEIFYNGVGAIPQVS